jgi:hypothetical protein
MDDLGMGGTQVMGNQGNPPSLRGIFQDGLGLDREFLG